MAGNGKADCGSKLAIVATETECRASAKVINKPFGSAGSFSAYPNGCFLYNDKLYFSTSKTGKAHSKANPVCMKDTKVKYRDKVKLIKDISQEKVAKQLDMCEGRCYSNKDCKSGLICLEREYPDAVPGCYIVGNQRAFPICYDPYFGGPKKLSGGDYNGSKKKLKRCTDECDKDSDCMFPLKCFQRSKGEPIPGCTGHGKSPSWDYCYDPNWSTVKPKYPFTPTTQKAAKYRHYVKKITRVSSGKPSKPLDFCQGTCRDDGDCKPGLVCLDRWSGDETPGCYITGNDGGFSICYDPRWNGVKKLSGSDYNGSKKKLQRCTHECDKDSECHFPLRCFKRKNGEAIPGCTDPGGISKSWEFCWDPNWNKPSVKKYYGE